MRRNATYKGLLGGDRKWLTIGLVMFWIPGFFKKAFGRSEEIVAVEKMKVGQTVRLDTVRLPTRRQRRVARRRAARA
jgi:hypothetical protein